MRRLLPIVMKEGASSIVLLVLLLALVWCVTFFTRGDNPDWMNLPMLITMCVIGLWVVLFIANKVMSARNAARIEKQLQAQSGAQVEGTSADKRAEAEALRQKFNESLDALKRTKGGKSALYTLPWYVIIGPPGSGKTTALQESGLNFPAIQGGAKVRGIGGTRNCDWWFTEDGILLDTAGRYTTVAEDQEEWLTFLEMIRTSRKSKPINGAIVAVSVDDLFRGTQTEIDQMAKDIRNRLDELSSRLQAVFPVYLMFTKCDLVSGFIEFFEDFNKEERSQVWGFTMAYSLPEKQYTSIFDEQCDRMLDNLRARQLELLGTERPAQKKQNIYLFPRQFQLAREKMRDLIGQLFGGTAFQEAAILRGVYFTSGTQKGTPIDQLMARLGEAMGMGGAPEGSDERIEKKSYFIHNLFARVMFPDKTLARSTSRVIRRRMAWKLGLQVLSVALFALVTFSAVTAFNDSRVSIGAIRDSGSEVMAHDETATETALLAALEKLDRLRVNLEAAAPTTLKLSGDEASRARRGWSWGTDNSSRMFDAGADVYVNALRPTFIEPSQRRVEAELRELLAISGGRSAEQWKSLMNLWRVYAMMAGDIEPSGALISTVLDRANRWNRNYSGDNASRIQALAREQLVFYAALLELGYGEKERYNWGIQADADLKQNCEQVLRSGLWFPTEYSEIIRYAHEAMPALTFRQIAPEVGDLLDLKIDPAAGTDLQFLNAFTSEAWNQQIKPLMAERAEALHRRFKELNEDEPVNEILERLYGMHMTRHAKVWDDFLASVVPVQGGFSSVQQANNALNKLAPKLDSPLGKLIRGAWEYRALDLSATQRVPKASDEDLKALEEALRIMNESYYTAFARFAANTEGGRVREYTGQEDNYLRTLSVNSNDAGSKIGSTLSGKNKQAGDFLLRVLNAGIEGVRADARKEIIQMWGDQVDAECSKYFVGKYPFDPESKDPAPLDKVAEFFNPANGKFWTFHNQLVAIQRLNFNGRPLFEFSDKYNRWLGHAQRMRDALFHNETDTRVNVEFELKLYTPDNLINGTLLCCGRDKAGLDKMIRYPDDRSKKLSWTQQEGSAVFTGGRLELKYAQDKPTIGEKDKELMDDPWGWFRLIHHKGLMQSGMEKVSTEYTIVWKYNVEALGGQVIQLTAFLTALKEANPFRPDFFSSVEFSDGAMK